MPPFKPHGHTLGPPCQPLRPLVCPFFGPNQCSPGAKAVHAQGPNQCGPRARLAWIPLFAIGLMSVQVY